MTLFYPKVNSRKDYNQNSPIKTTNKSDSEDDDDYSYLTESQELREY